MRAIRRGKMQRCSPIDGTRFELGTGIDQRGDHFGIGAKARGVVQWCLTTGSARMQLAAVQIDQAV